MIAGLRTCAQSVHVELVDSWGVDRENDFACELELGKKFTATAGSLCVSIAIVTPLPFKLEMTIHDVSTGRWR